MTEQERQRYNELLSIWDNEEQRPKRLISRAEKEEFQKLKQKAREEQEQKKKGRTMQIITITNRKGGTAKTETARAIGGGLSLKGYKVLFVDLDAQRNLSTSTGADTSKSNAYNLILGECKAADAIQETEQGHIIAASTMLYSADRDIKSVYVFRDMLKGLKYDFIIIDTPPNYNKLTIAAMAAANGLIIPTQADIYSLTALKEMKEEVDNAREHNKGLKVYGVCITRYANNRVSKDMATALKTIAEMCGTKLYNTFIRENVAIKESTAMCKSIYQYAPRSNGAKDYLSLTEEVLKDLQKK